MLYLRIITRIAALCFLLIPVLAIRDLHAQIPGTEAPQIRPTGRVGRFASEVRTSEVSPGFVRALDQRQNPNLKRPSGDAQKLIRVVYLVPADKTFKLNYQSALAAAMVDLQSFFQNEVGNGNRFTLHSPIVEVHHTPHNSAWYATNPSPGPQPAWFYENAVLESYLLTGTVYNDPNNRWIIYIDADPACGQFMGGNAGVALMAANDLRGLAGESLVATCPGDPPDVERVGRWIGGSGHELAHTFNVPHPSGCGETSCKGGPFVFDSLMWAGFFLYPDTHFLTEDKQILLASGFFSNDFPVTVSGRITAANGRPVFGARVALTGEGVPERYAATNPSGYYRFPNVTAGRTYTLSPQHKRMDFAPRAISPSADLLAADFTGQ